MLLNLSYGMTHLILKTPYYNYQYNGYVAVVDILVAGFNGNIEAVTGMEKQL